MFDWWLALATPDQVFWGIALLTSAILILQLILAAFGFDGDLDADMDFDADFDADLDHGDGYGILSVRTVTAFLTGFGWGGVIALDYGFSVPAAVAIAVATGGVLMMSIYFLMRTLYGMRYEGNLDYKNAVGAHGSVYLPVPPKMEGLGQVEVLVQGRLRTVQAMTRAAEKLPNRARVKIVGVVDPQTLLVEPLG